MHFNEIVHTTSPVRSQALEHPTRPPRPLPRPQIPRSRAGVVISPARPRMRGSLLRGGTWRESVVPVEALLRVGPH
jgi:hypothetical protein